MSKSEAATSYSLIAVEGEMVVSEVDRYRGTTPCIYRMTETKFK
jgi:hypothetical protein